MEIDSRAYSGAIYDIIKFDFKHTAKFVLPRDIVPIVRPIFSPHKFVFGRAFTARGDKTTIPNHAIVADMIDEMDKDDIYILQANDNSRAHFGDIMAHFLKSRKVKGAIIQGWTRDHRKIQEIGFPLWAKGVQPQDSVDRWGITYYLDEIVIGNIFISPKDYIFADEDAVLVIRRFFVKDLLDALPEKLDYEDQIREDIASGKSASTIYNTRGRW
jgi:regulator of RNase E activity RraA